MLNVPLHQVPACPILSPPRVRCAQCLFDVSSKPAPRPDRGVVAGQGHAEAGTDGSWRCAAWAGVHCGERFAAAGTIWHEACAIQQAGTGTLRPIVHGEGMSRAGTVQAYSQGSADPPREGLQPGVEANLASTPTNLITSTGLATMRPENAKCGQGPSLCI
ncbi:hypothetical protein E1301_Tti014800 [Triplophysa tibetana]|uniref:Uncharacterized protein n=1 Tax=Triplophysa tibetana TaxID=1572043 RepID=A0A5A9PSW4_9TELE|nr:hypothetical protein E1301_Tti014800 [Triplophysa tibetana]